MIIDEKAYLCPGDANMENANSLVSREWVYSQLEKSQASQKLMIVDACRNEILISGSKSAGNARTLEDPTGAVGQGFILLASCRPKQVSWEIPELEHGVFTHFLAEDLRGGAKNAEGYVSILSLADYASQKTKTYVYRNLNTLQVPMIKMPAEMTNFLLAKIETPEPAVEPGTASVPPTGQPISQPVKPVVRSAGERLVKTVDGIDYAFRWCPAGTFMMGSPESEPDRNVDETQHEVTLTKGFWMLETEVTQAMWKSVMGTTVRQQRDKVNSSWSLKGEGGEYPIYYVNWEECKDFCERLSSKLGVSLSLPTEAQWEYACRAGTTGAYAGNLDAMAWYNGTLNTGSTHPVGQKKPNAWGGYDMHGNVWEWCLDWYESDFYAESPTSDPLNSAGGSSRVGRGGSWDDLASYCRSADRYGDTPGLRYSNLGFRMVWQDSGE